MCLGEVLLVLVLVLGVLRKRTRTKEESSANRNVARDALESNYKDTAGNNAIEWNGMEYFACESGMEWNFTSKSFLFASVPSSWKEMSGLARHFEFLAGWR